MPRSPREVLKPLGVVSAILIAIFSFSAPFLLDAGRSGQDAYILVGFFILGLTFGQSSGAVSSRFTQQYRYTGAALKACKCQSQALLMAAACRKYRMFLCVQDLTCPGASLIHSASVAAYVPGVAGIEANARQYVPAANKGWEERFPGLFRISDGTLATEILTRPGLGAV